MSTSARLGRFTIIAIGIVLPACTGLGMHVENPRTLSAQTGENALVYFVLNNGSFSEDTFLGASSDVAGSVEIHRSALIKPADRAEMEAGGAYHYEAEEEEEEEKGELAKQEAKLAMGTLDSMRITSGHELEFEPGYYHLMLIGLKRDLNIGDQFEITLHFAKSVDVQVTVEVVEEID